MDRSEVGGTEIPFEILTRAYIPEEIRRKNQSMIRTAIRLLLETPSRPGQREKGTGPGSHWP